MVGGLIAPPLRTVLGHRSLMVLSALLHVAVYAGMIVLTEWAVLLGSVVTGMIIYSHIFVLLLFFVPISKLLIY
jgi:hypothetical protein